MRFSGWSHSHTHATTHKKAVTTAARHSSATAWTHLQVPIHDTAQVQVLQTERDLGAVEACTLLREATALGEVVVQLAAVEKVCGTHDRPNGPFTTRPNHPRAKRPEHADAPNTMYSLCSVWKANRKLTMNGWFIDSRMRRSLRVWSYCLRFTTISFFRIFIA
jgi:hypothetical protein